MIRNMTPHEVVLITEKETLKFPSEGSIRLSSKTEQVGMLEGIPITKTIFGSSELPKYKKGTYYIVSSLICQAFPDRKDFLIVNETIRNDKGQIIGCRSLSPNPYNDEINEQLAEKYVDEVINNENKI